MEGAGVGGFVEIEITAENLVGTLAAQHHLNAHRFYDAGQKVHRRACANGCNIVCLNMINNIANGIQTFLNGVVHLVVDGAQVLGHHAGLRQIGRALYADGKRVQTRPPGIGFVASLDSLCGIHIGNGRNYRTVQSAREQNSVGHVAHQLALDGGLQRVAKCGRIGTAVFNCLILKPVARPPALHTALAAAVVMAWQEGLVAVAEAFESLEFAGRIHSSVGIEPNVERNDADWVAGNQKLVAFFVVKGKGENAVQIFQKVDSLFFIQGENDFAVGPRLESVGVGHLLANLLVVVNLTVDGQNLLAVS